jgi:iron complex transport system permease protein
MKTKFYILILASVFLLLMDLALGSTYIPIGSVFQILIGNERIDENWQTIVLAYRMPRVLAAAIVGAGLSISGLLMQTLFRNPIAGPYVLGISSGASLGVAILLLSASSFSFIAANSAWALVGMAGLGAFLVLMLMLSIAWRVREVASLLIVGLMVGSATSAIVSVLEYFSGLHQLKQFVLWSLGSLTRISFEELKVLAIVCAIGLLGSFSVIKALNALLVGEEYAQSMGVKVMPVRFVIIFVTAVLAGSITAFAGPIAFVGIATPHLARMLFKTQNHQILLPATLLIGVVIMLFCDIIAQMPGSEQQLPINAVTSLLGAPMVIWIVVKGG